MIDTLQAYIDDNQILTENSILRRFVAYNFPKPTKLQLARWIRSFVNWVILVLICYYGVEDAELRVTMVLAGSLLGGILLPNTTPVRQIFTLLVMNIGTVIGLSLMMLCYWFVTLYNLGPVEPKSSLALALLILSFLLFFTYWLAVVQYSNANLIGVFALTASSFVNLLVMSGVRLEDVKAVPVGRYKILALTSIIVLIGMFVEIFILPESNTEGLRRRMCRVLVDMDHMCDFGTLTRESISRLRQMYYNILMEVGLMKADMQATAMDVGWFYDAPPRLVDVSSKLITTTHHLGCLAHALEHEVSFGGTPSDEQSQLMTQMTLWIRQAIVAVHDGLITKPGLLGPLTAHEVIHPMKTASIDDTIRVQFDVNQCNQYLEKQPSDSWSRQSVAFTLGCLQLAMNDVLLAVEQLKLDRPSHAKFWFPHKSQPPKAKQKRPEKTRVRHGFSWYCNEAVYRIFGHFASDASHFATKKAFIMFIIAVWAYIPSTSVWFAENNGFWILIAALMVISPTLGATIGKAGSRVIGSCIGVVWAILAFYVSEGDVGVVLLFAIPIVLLSLYLQNCSKQAYTGNVMLLTYNVIAFSRNKLVQDAGFRALFQLLACTVALLVTVFVYPSFARVQVRMSMANVLRNVGELLQRTLFVPSVSNIKSTPQGQEAAGLYGASQGMLTQVRLNLHDAAAEPNIDRPYLHSIMVAIQVTIQHLLNDFTAVAQVEMTMRKSEKLDMWNEMLQGCKPQQADLIHSLSNYLCTLAATLVNKSPLPVQSPRVSCRRFLSDFTILAHCDDPLVGFLSCSLVSIYQSTLSDVETLEQLLIELYGQSTWYTVPDDKF
jgi:hypothetical protein